MDSVDVGTTIDVDIDIWLRDLVNIPTETKLPEITPYCNEHCVSVLEESENVFVPEEQTSFIVLGVDLRGLENIEIPKIDIFECGPGGADGIKSCQDSQIQQKEYPCLHPSCGRIYTKASHLRAHQRRHTGEKPFRCDWPRCEWRFSRSDELARHRRSHSGLKPYSCSSCYKKFARSDHLAKHFRIHSKQPPPPRRFFQL